jgi:hypothetical protein
VWETEAPPVHLWWFSANSVKRLGKAANSDVEILDLSECEIQAKAAPSAVVRTRRSPILNADSEPISRLRTILYRIGLLGAAKAAYKFIDDSRRVSSEQADTTKREVLAALFRKR